MNFKDKLFQDYEVMLKFRRSAGYSTGSDELYIPSFISFCGEHYPDAGHITREMVSEWIASYSFRRKGTQSNAVGIIRHFTSFLNSTGNKAYIPDDDFGLQREQYTPYIYNDYEIRVLFDAIDSTPSTLSCPNRAAIVPVLFRMMYCCGMRPGEPIRLKTSDVDLRTGDIYIRQSKRSKDRHIIMADDLRDLCIRYDRLSGDREWFFQKADGMPFSSSWTLSQFNSAWQRSRLKGRHKPRPYDFRHCFATRNIMNWVDAGKDIMGLLPYLSAYMGHTKFSHTLYYVHLLPDRLRKSANIDWDQFRPIYGEEACNEED